MRELADQFLAFAEKQKATGPLVHAHRIMGISLLCTGDIAEGRVHLDRAIALHDPGEHRQLATHFGQDARVSTLCYQSHALWLLGYPEAARTNLDEALSDAREIGHFATLWYALALTSLAHILQGNYAAAHAQYDEVVALANEKGAAFAKGSGTAGQGWVMALTGNAADAVDLISSGRNALLSTGATLWTPMALSFLTKAYAQLNQFDDASRCIGEAMTAIDATKERWWEAEVNRVAGEIALESPRPDTAKAEAYFERALEVARKQQARSWELRAAMSMARLWRDQGKVQQARELLAPVYGWFAEGFDTHDLKEAKALLSELA